LEMEGRSWDLECHILSALYERGPELTGAIRKSPTQGNNESLFVHQRKVMSQTKKGTLSSTERNRGAKTHHKTARGVCPSKRKKYIKRKMRSTYQELSKEKKKKLTQAMARKDCGESLGIFITTTGPKGLLRRGRSLPGGGECRNGGETSSRRNTSEDT